MSATEYYNHTTFPASNAAGSSASMRAELEAVEAGFGKLPDLSGNGGKVVAVNAGGTALEAVSSLTVAQGGTGRATGTTAYGLIAAGTTATGEQQTLAAGLTTQILVGGGANALPVWTAATGSGAPVRATSPTLVTPNIGVATATSVNGVVLNLGPGGVSTNVALGSAALQNEATGGSIVAIGPSALASSNGASFNTAIGGGALNALTTGAGNTAVGYLAGWSDVTTGSYNTFLGYQSGNGLGARTGSNNTAIGKEAKPSNLFVSNEITLGNSSITALRCQVTSITSLSDARDKMDVTPLTTGLSTVMQLNPVRFTWNMRDGGKVGIKDAGFIAQELQTVDDDWLRLVYAENPEKLEASYGRLIPVLVKAIQELKQEVDDLRAQLLG